MGQFGRAIAVALEKALAGALKSAEIEALLERPPEREMGDIAFPCFKLAGVLKRNPADIAQQLASEVRLPKGIERAEQKGPYVNFFISEAALAESALGAVLEQKEKFGSENLGKGKKIMVEYSGPNTNKPLHVGHLRNDSLGMCISNVLEKNGYNVIRANLVNDRGIHICKSMLAYQKWAAGQAPESEGKKGDRFVGDLYIKFSQEAKKNPALEDEARELLKKWESGDKETIALWKKMNSWAIAGMKKTYGDFGSEFDAWFMESEFYNKAGPIIREGLEKGVFKKNEEGATIAVLEPYGLANKTVLRADGTSIYITNDLAVTKHRFEKYGLDEAMWVVGSEQNLYFRQLFKIFELLGYSWAKDCRHLSYGMVFLPEGKLKSREGRVVEADDLIVEVRELAEREVRARYQGLSEKEAKSRAKGIALGAIKFFLLRTDAARDMAFDPKQAVSFEGETGPYVMYSYARAKSILRKAGGEKKALSGKRDFSALKTPEEKRVVSLIARYPEAVGQVLRSLSPHTLCQHLLELSAAFNSFYHAVPVLKAGKGEKEARLALVAAAAQALKNGLGLLNIVALEQM